MEPDELTVDPGSQVTTKVTVRNLGTRVEEFELVVQGPGASFAAVAPATVSIYPDVEQRAVVRFSPTRGPQSPAGVSTFEVVARSVVHADVRDVARGRLTVTAFEDLQAVLKPDASRGRKPGRHLVSVTNGGNTPVNSQVAFTDQGSVLTFDPRDKAVALQPGDTVDVPVLLNGPRRWFGRTEQLPFSAVVSPTGSQPPITLNGIRQQTAVFAWWVPPAAVVALGLMIALAALVIPWLTRTPTVPVIGPVDEAAAVKQLKDADYVPEPIPRGDDKTPKGLTIGTDPTGGAQLKKGETVKLFVSSGECAGGPCPVEVPIVEGLPVSEAQAKLEEKKFTVSINRVPSEDRPVDRVIASEPKATTMRPPNSPVQLTVSTGPPQKVGGNKGPENKGPENKGPENKGPENKGPENKGPENKGPENKGPENKGPENKGPVPVPLPPPPTLVTIPDLTAGSAEDATKALTDLKLKAKAETVRSNAVPDGQVLSTTPTKGSKVAPESVVTLTVAKNTTPVDLIAAAKDASWATLGSDDSTTPTPLTFPGAVTDSTGFVRTTTAEEDDTITVLETSPPPTGSIIGTYTLEQPVVKGDHLRARIRLFPATGTGDVKFLVKAKDAKGKDIAIKTEIRPVTIDNVTFKELDADLSPAKGATTIKITEEDASTTPQRAQWHQFQLEPKIG